MPSEPVPVVIVGAGPVGLATALGLAQRGVEVAVLEAGDTVCRGSRAICLSRQSLQLLDRLGVGDRFAELSLPWVRGRSFYRDREVLSFTMPAHPTLARPPMVNISQSVAEQALVDAAGRVDGVTVHWRSEVVGIRPGPNSVTLDVETPAGRRAVTAAWVVAADGARSRVRQRLGLKMHGTSYEGRYVIADIHWPVTRPAERLVWFDPPSNPGATIIMHRQPDDIWRVDYQLGPDDDAEIEVGVDRVRDRIARHLDWLGNAVPWTVEWVSLYRAHSLSLDEYRHGRVLFAGDAAHLVPIFGVRGLNSGFEDAGDLAWKLPLVLRGVADEALLDTYAAERRDAWRQNVNQADKSTQFMTPGSYGYEVTRDAVLALAVERPELRVLVNPRQTSGTHARRSPISWPPDASREPRPGDVVEDRLVRRVDGSATRLRTVTGVDFSLIGCSVDSETLTMLAGELAEALGGVLRVTTVLVGKDVLDPDRTLRDALGLADGEILVVRPDGRVLCRLDRGRLQDAAVAAKDLIDTVRRGRHPARGHDGSTHDEPVPQDMAETAWRAVSELLDSVPKDQREVALARLAMLLAVQLDADDGQRRLLEMVAEVARLSGPDTAS